MLSWPSSLTLSSVLHLFILNHILLACNCRILMHMPVTCQLCPYHYCDWSISHEDTEETNKADDDEDTSHEDNDIGGCWEQVVPHDVRDENLIHCQPCSYPTHTPPIIWNSKTSLRVYIHAETMMHGCPLGKKKVVFPLTWPTLFYRPYPTGFNGKLVDTELEGWHTTVITRSSDCKSAGHWTILMRPYGKGKNKHFNQCFNEIKYKIKKKK